MTIDHSIRLKNRLRKYKETYLTKDHLEENEAQTTNMVEKFLSEVLGYDNFDDFNSQVHLRRNVADMVINKNGKHFIVIEVKPITYDLQPKHLKQAMRYAKSGYMDWVMITNGKEYQFYRVVNKQPLESELVFKVNLIEDDVFINNYEDFAYITKDAVENNGLYDFWKRKSALKSDYLAHLIYSKEVMKLMQKAIKKRKGVYFEENIVRDALKEVITNSIETDLDYITNLHKHV